MAQEYCTGAVYVCVGPSVYVSPPAGSIGARLGGVQYLGLCENMPDQSVERSYRGIRNDLLSEKPIDYIYAGGREAVLGITLTRLNMTVLNLLESAPLSGLQGSDTVNDIGSIMGQEGLALSLYLVYQFGGVGPARPTMIGQEAGKRYVQALFWGPDRHESGTKEVKKHCVFRAFKYINKATGIFTLWDNQIAAAVAAVQAAGL